MSKTGKKTGGVKEMIRKWIVSLKRTPQTIPLLMLLFTFCYYSFNLTSISNTTAKIQGVGMGLCQFCMMLFTLLSIVCMLNAFPKRKKPVWPMVGLMFGMFAVVFYCSVHYRTIIHSAVTRAVSPIVVDANTLYITDAYSVLYTFQILIVVTALLVVTLPLYSKLIRKIKTSVDVEDNGDMATIEIED